MPINVQYDEKNNDSIEISEPRINSILQVGTVFAMIIPFIAYIVINKVSHIIVLVFGAIFMLAMIMAIKGALKKSLSGSRFIINKAEQKITYNSKPLADFSEVQEVKFIQKRDRQGRKFWTIGLTRLNDDDIFLGIDQDRSKVRTLAKKTATLIGVKVSN